MMVTKNDQVEVCSEEEGFKGAWFKAVLEENPTKSGRKKLFVRYKTLLDPTGSSPLIEYIPEKFIRPVPPKEEFSEIGLEEGVKVDAYHKDGWWTGVVIKKMEQDKFLVYFNYPPDLIYFHIKKLRAHIRWTGLKWARPEIQVLLKSMFCCGEIVEVSCVIDKKETTWSPAMIVTETEEEEEGDKKMFIVKYCDKDLNFISDDASANETVDASRVRPTPLCSLVNVYELLDCVEVFRGLSWRQGLVRRILSENCYSVSFGTTKKEAVFKCEELRPLMEWVDGGWLKGSIKEQLVKETDSNSIRNKSMLSCSSGVKPMTPNTATTSMKRSLNFEENVETLTKAETIATAEKSRKKMAVAVARDDSPLPIIKQVNTIESVSSVTPSPVMKQPVTENGAKASPFVVIPQVNTIAKESVSSVTPSPVMQQPAETGPKTCPFAVNPQVNTLAKDSVSLVTPSPVMKQPVAEKTLEQVRNPEDVTETELTQQKMPEEKNSEENSRKRKRDPNETGGAEISNTSKSICKNGGGAVDDQPLSTLIDHTPSMVKNSAAVTQVDQTQAEDTVMSFPFEKKSPFWKRCETMEGFKALGQKPHFNPLCEASEVLREFSALGMTVTFYSLLDEVKDLKLDDSPSKLNSFIVDLAKLEKHGFNVEAPRLRICKLLSLHADRAMKTEEMKCFEKKIEEVESEMRKAEEEIAEFQRLEALAKKKKEACDKDLVEMKSSVERVGQERGQVELEFQKTVLAPW